MKLYLYNNEHALGLSHHNTHIRQFGDFSRGWGIGEETYEFWSWVARQYRVLAELIDQGARAGLTLPVHQPPPASALGAPKAAGAGMIPELESMARSAGINPSHALQHSGFYYYMAAKCTDARRARFLAALEAEGNGHPIAISPGFSNEKKVDHLALVLEVGLPCFRFASDCVTLVALALYQGVRTVQTTYPNTRLAFSNSSTSPNGPESTDSLHRLSHR